jgi:small subunit ribosomal protein S17
MVKKQKETNEAAQKAAVQDSKTLGTECADKFCPFHGSSKLHGRVLFGTVVSAKAHKTATVDKLRTFYLHKYERYEKRHTKVLVHNPPCLNAKLGEEVKIMETRPLSKTKHFIIIEVLNRK